MYMRAHTSKNTGTLLRSQVSSVPIANTCLLSAHPPSLTLSFLLNHTSTGANFKRCLCYNLWSVIGMRTRGMCFCTVVSKLGLFLPSVPPVFPSFLLLPVFPSLLFPPVLSLTPSPLLSPTSFHLSIPPFIHPSLPKGVLLCSYPMCGNVSSVRGWEEGGVSQTAC